MKSMGIFNFITKRGYRIGRQQWMVSLKVVAQQTIQLNTLTKEHDCTLTFGTNGSQGMFLSHCCWYWLLGSQWELENEGMPSKGMPTRRVGRF
jgi:hypothetical protein